MSLIGSIIASLFLVFFFIHLGFENETVSRGGHSEKDRMQYALVNEDLGAVFEDQNYALGQDFVTLINKDMNNRWETTTRSIATSGVEEGYFDAKIIIPQDFSEKLLSLQSIRPEHALIEYQVREGQNEITNQVIRQNVDEIVQEFNQRVIQMYFSSIVGNLSEAQRNVNQMTGTQISHQERLEGQVYTPFKEIPGTYADILNVTSILDEGNQTFQSEQQAFVQSVFELLEGNSQTLAEAGESTVQVKDSIHGYTEEANSKIRQAVDQFTDQFEVHKQQLEEQWRNDTSNYRNQHDDFHSTIVDQLNAFYTSSSGQSTGVYSDFLTSAKTFQVTQTARLDELEVAISDLEKQVTSLKELKTEVALIFYDDEQATPETVTEEQVKAAIIKLIQKEGERTPNLNEDYFETIASSLKQVSDKSLEFLLIELVKQELIAEELAALFLSELTIVRRYAEEFDLTLGADSRFAMLEEGEIHRDVISIPAEVATFSIDTHRDTTISLRNDDDAQGRVSFHLDAMRIAQVEKELNQQLSASNYQTSIVNVTPESFTITQPVFQGDGTSLDANVLPKVGVEEDGEMNVDTEEESEPVPQEEEQLPPSMTVAKRPSKISMTINLPVTWSLTEQQQKRSYNEIAYYWSDGVTRQIEQSYAVYINMDQPLVDDLSELMNQFQKLNTAAQQIVTLLGNPEESLTIQGYATMLGESHANGKTMIELAGEDSVYRRYGNITDSELKELITERLYEEYKNAGDNLYTKVDDQIVRLISTIGTTEDQNSQEDVPTLYGLLNLMTVPDKLLQEAEKLNHWFDDASQQINRSYQSWMEAEKIDASTVVSESNPHPSENDTGIIDIETEAIIQTLRELVNSSQSAITFTEQSAANVQDVAPLINELNETTTQVQNDAQGILTTLSQTVSESGISALENQEYAQVFEKVLENTRVGGADNQQVFHFLSGPIQGTGEFGRTQQTSLLPYYTTLISAILFLLVPNILQGYMGNRVARKKDFLTEQTIVWRNTLNMVIVVSTTVLLSAFFATITTLNAGSINKFSWFTYAFLVIASGLLLILAGIRQYKKMTLYIYGLVLGLYLMLTPILGVTTTPGSLVSLLYRLSPLQNIQNGYTALLNGWRVSWGTYVVLILLTGLGLGLNMIVRPTDKRGGEYENETT